MTTIIDSRGRLIGYGDGTLVQGSMVPYGKEVGCKVICTTSLAPAAGTTITWSSARYDTAGFVASFPSTNIVIPQAGWYSIIAYAKAGGSPGHTGQLIIRCNGVDLVSDRCTFLADGNVDNGLNIAMSWYYFSKGDVITVFWDTNGVTVSTSTQGEPGVSCAVWRES
jgi:hypothetical protein